MHEISICRALLRRVAAVVDSSGARTATAVRVRCGPLSGIEPRLLTEAFRVARAGTCAARAELTIEWTALRIACLECAGEAEAAANALSCPACGSERTRLLSGDELLLTGIDVLAPRDRAAHFGAD